MAKNLLANDLKKYYSRKGNRFVFSNGATLNKLALDMWEKLGYRGVDASVLSRVFKGERLFTFDQLNTFCDVLALGEAERDAVKESLRLDLAERYNLTNLFLENNDEYIHTFEEQVDKIRQARLSDALVFASDWADDLRGLLHEEISNQKDTDMRQRLLLILAKLLKEMGHLKLGISSSRNVGKNVLTIGSELIDIGNMLEDETIIGNGYSFIGPVQYVLKDYVEAVESLEKGVARIKDPEEKCYCIRLLALSYAYLGKKEEFLRVKDEMMLLEGQLSLYEKCELYEGVGRGLALIGFKKESEKYIGKSFEMLKKIEGKVESYRVARRLQLTRSQIEVGMINDDSDIIRNADTLGDESIQISKMFGYNSYGEKIGKLLKILS